MLFTKILGNITDLEDYKNYKIDRIILKSDDLEKKILRVTTVNGIEHGIDLKESGDKLTNGSILFDDGELLIIVETELERALIISPTTMEQMGEIAHFLGNMHTPIKIENDKIYLHYDKYLENTLKEKNYPFEIKNFKFKKALRHIDHSHGHIHQHGHSHE